MTERTQPHVVTSASPGTSGPRTPAIELRGVHKSFPIYTSKGDQFGAMLFGHRWRNRQSFQALKGIDLVVNPGETLGLLGVNGAGKSTLLQVIAQTLNPSAGSVVVNGRIAAILELGAGFNAAWTGRENVIFHCRINDISTADIPHQVDRIRAFADIGAFFDQPMKTYSSGMYMRVAFAAAIMVEPDILIVDEALAVGDARFQQKCFTRFRALQEAGKTILFVTHATDLIPQYCTRAIILQAGQILHDGPPREAVERYTELLFSSANSGMDDDAIPDLESDAINGATSAVDWSGQLQPVPFGEDGLSRRPYYNNNEHRHGSGEARIVDVAIRGQEGAKSYGFKSGERLTLGILIATESVVPPLSVGVFLLTTGGIRVFGTATLMNGATQIKIDPHEQVVISLSFDVPLYSGSYFLDLSIFNDQLGHHRVFDVRHAAIELQISSNFTFNGLVNLNAAFEMGHRFGSIRRKTNITVASNS